VCSSDLRQALAAALVNNPQLIAFAWENRAREADALQAGLGPNPELELEIENFGGSGEVAGFQGAETTLALSQLVELGDKRRKRLAVAELQQTLSAWDYEVARLDVLTATTKSFITALAAQENVTLANELTNTAQEMLDAVTRRVRAGSASPVEKSWALVNLETSRMEVTRAEHNLASARQKLASRWGSITPAFAHLEGDLNDTPAPADLSVLQQQLVHNTEVLRWATEMDQRRAAVDLEKALGKIDLSLGGGVRHIGGSDDVAFVVNVGLPLKFNDSNQGATRAAEFRVERAAAQQQAATVQLTADLVVMHQALLANDAEITALRDLALPEAEKAMAFAQTAYMRGALRFSDVLATRSMRFTLKKRYFDALAAYHTTVADLERLTGTAMETNVSATGRP